MPKFPQTVVATGGGNRRFITSADGLVTGEYFAITVYSNAVIAELTLGPGEVGADKAVGLTLPAGFSDILFVTSIRLTSGVIHLFGA